MKRVIAMLLLAMSLVLFVSCDSAKDEMIEVPDVTGIKAESAEQIIINNGLIPEIVFASDEYVEKGLVISCFPDVGIKVEKNDKITIYVSSGQSEKSATSYECVDVKDDGFFNFELKELTIKEGYLNIELEVEPLYDGGTYIKLSFLDSGVITFNNNGKEIPVTYSSDRQSIKYKEKQSIYVQVPMEKIDVDVIDRFIFKFDFNVNQPDFNFKPYDKTSTSSTFWWNIRWE